MVGGSDSQEHIYGHNRERGIDAVEKRFHEHRWVYQLYPYQLWLGNCWHFSNRRFAGVKVKNNHSKRALGAQQKWQTSENEICSCEDSFNQARKPAGIGSATFGMFWRREDRALRENSLCVSIEKRELASASASGAWGLAMRPIGGQVQFNRTFGEGKRKDLIGIVERQ
jgi:hypothetical protein